MKRFIIKFSIDDDESDDDQPREMKEEEGLMCKKSLSRKDSRRSGILMLV